MADENQELQREMAELTQAMQGLDTATKSASVSLVGLAKNAATGLGSFAKQVGQGDTTFKSLNKIVDVTTDALAGLAKAVPYAGEAVAAGLKATAEAAKFMLDQMDQTTQAFNELGKVGALTASGMSGLQQQFLTSGLSLKTFTKQVADNSVALARFRGMTGDGAEAFSEIAGKLTQGGDDSLRRLGMSADQIGESVAGFVTQQTRLGRAQTMTNAQLEKGAKDYAMQLDELSKLTGQSADSLRKQQDAALSESRFRASINSLNKEQQDELLKLQSIMQGFGAEMGQGTRDLVSGAANTEAARKLMVDTGGAAQDIINRLKAGQIDTAQATKELQAAVQKNLKASENYSQFQSDASGAMGNFASKADFATARFDQFGNRIKDVQKSQVEGTDDLTNKTVAAQKNMERMNIEIQKLGFTFLPKAADAVEAMTGVMNRFVRYINEKIGGGPNAAPSGGGPAGVSREFGGEGTGGTGAEAGAPEGPTGTMGLKVKPGAEKSGKSEDALYAVAQQVHTLLGGDYKYFSGFKDREGDSKHATGRAFDIVLNDPAQYQSVLSKIQGVPGVKFAQYEKAGHRNPNGSIATGDHIHAEISAARGFNGVLSGPSSGYQPNLTMHGTESISIQPATPAATAAGMMDSGLMKAQLDRLDELVSVMKSQLSVSTKIMQYSH